jgi:hypothetical protein
MYQGANGRTVLELNLATDPISGFVRLSDGRRVQFSGYLGLLALLRRLRQLQDGGDGAMADHPSEVE